MRAGELLGLRWHGHNVAQRDFRKIAKDAGLRRVRLHDLRHAHTSYLALAGVPIKTAMERLGHSNPQLTLKVYTHVLAGQQEDAAMAIQGLLLGGKKPR